MKFTIHLFLIFLLVPSISIEQQTEVISEKYSSESIQGYWTVNIDENISFIIKGDSIFFFEYLNDPLPIKVRDDSLFIYYENFITSKKIINATPSQLVLVGFNQDTITYFNTL